MGLNEQELASENAKKRVYEIEGLCLQTQAK